MRQVAQIIALNETNKGADLVMTAGLRAQLIRYMYYICICMHVHAKSSPLTGVDSRAQASGIPATRFSMLTVHDTTPFSPAKLPPANSQNLGERASTALWRLIHRTLVLNIYMHICIRTMRKLSAVSKDMAMTYPGLAAQGK